MPSKSEPNVYQIKIKGYLGSQWSEWFDGFKLTTDDEGNTLFTGPVIDDSALYGLIKKIRNLGLTLISFNQIESGYEESNDNEKEDES